MANFKTEWWHPARATCRCTYRIKWKGEQARREDGGDTWGRQFMRADLYPHGK